MMASRHESRMPCSQVNSLLMCHHNQYRDRAAMNQTWKRSGSLFQCVILTAVASCASSFNGQPVSRQTDEDVATRVYFPGFNKSEEKLFCWYVEADPNNRAGYACWSSSLGWSEGPGYGLIPTLEEFCTELRSSIMNSSVTTVTLIGGLPESETWMLRKHPGYRLRQLTLVEMNALASIDTRASIQIEYR